MLGYSKDGTKPRAAVEKEIEIIHEAVVVDLFGFSSDRPAASHCLGFLHTRYAFFPCIHFCTWSRVIFFVLKFGQPGRCTEKNPRGQVFMFAA